MSERSVSWGNVLAVLARWHASGDRNAGRAAVSFLEVEFRLMVPGIVRRTWPEDLVDDAIQGILERLVKRPLPAGIDDSRRYLARALRNRCIDLYDARRRRREQSLDDAPAGWEPPADAAASPVEMALQEERVQQIQTAIAQLDISDRVVLKLDHAPEWLTEDETSWLARRAGLASRSLPAAIAAAHDMHALTRIFDPGDDNPDDAALRRKRMERFRRRRSRARERLREFLEEVGR